MAVLCRHPLIVHLEFILGKNMRRNRIGIDVFLIVYIYFAVLVVGFVFACTDAEYNYNQQIARGFITKDAVFFDLDDLSYRTASVSFTDEEDNYPVRLDPIDESFVLKNKTLEDGRTAVETLLMSGSGNYLASLHSGLLRGVTYKGKIMPPPLISGRFFAEEECLSDYPFAVIGRKYRDSLFSRNGKQYIDYMNREYEVIGIAGLSGESPIDEVIFVNLGSLTPEEQLKGMYYIDCSSNNGAVYDEMCLKSQGLFGCGLKIHSTPRAFIDIVADGMYLKNYLKILMVLLGVIAFINVLIQSIRKKLVEIAVMKVQGIRLEKVIVRTIKPFVIAFLAGLLAGLLVNIGLTVFGVFSLPIGWLIRYCATMTIAGFFMMFVWIFVVFIVEWKLDPKEVIQKV